MNHGGKRLGAGRPKGQGIYGTVTKAIRVPEHMVDDVKNYALQGGYKIPLFSSNVAAGGPAFADDHIEEMIDMSSLLVKNPKSTFCVKVSGLSMLNAGICEGDMLVVDSSINPSEGKIVIAALNGMLTVKRLAYEQNGAYLLPENPDFDPIPINEESDVRIWGVVTNILKAV